jgi:thiol-disulfide isomerase/thioredoxin
MIVTVLLGCSGEPAEPPQKRFDAVMADPNKVTPPNEFCDNFSPEDKAKPFTVPPLAGTAWTPPTGQRWVNVWATWCGPCVAEMPKLVKWRDQLEKEKVPVELVFLSVDSAQPEVDRFYAQHPGLPPSLRISDVGQLQPWLTAVGLDASTAIPLHFFLDAEGRTRCERAGALSDTDYPAIKRLLGG